MKIKETYPPNIQDIRRYFPIDDPNFHIVFTYGDTIYNPKKLEIPDDVKFHEKVHSEQQQVFTDPSLWWIKYCNSPQFRLEQEVEAYALQYELIKQSYPHKARKEALFDLAQSLSSGLYGIKLSHQEAESKIRNYLRIGI